MSTRNARLWQWIKAAPEHERVEPDERVMWGVFCGVGDDSVHPPDAVFRDEKEAGEWADMVADGREYALLPCIVGVMTRDNVEVPE